MTSKNNDKWIVETIVPEEVYTDREEFLEYFYNAALNAATRGTMSTVLLGQRRMGKTEIFKRVVNRLFFEQDHGDPNAVVPVYFSFPDWAKDPAEFARNYIENFMRYYLGFDSAPARGGRSMSTAPGIRRSGFVRANGSRTAGRALKF